MGKMKMEKEIIEKVFENEFRLIKNEQLKSFVINFLTTIHNDFWIIPTSTTGKYHPALCNRQHGLVLHTKLVCSYSMVLCEALIEKNEFANDEISIIISSCLLHDISKQKKYSNYNDYLNHPLIASDLIKDDLESNMLIYQINSRLAIGLIEGVKYHSGIFTPAAFKKSINEYSLNQFIIYLADFLASRKNQNHQAWIESQWEKLNLILKEENK